MNFEPRIPPRVFEVGFGPIIAMKDCGRLRLNPDEQVTCLTDDGGEYDVVRKDWGFYATPSLNGRLARFGLRGVMALNRLGHLFVLLVEKGREESFARYLADEGLKIVHWLDDAAQVERLVARLGEAAVVCPICGGGAHETALTYDAPPPGETRFDLRGSAYRREYRRCQNCGHFLSVHEMDLGALYDGAYVDATYGSPEGMRRTFDRVVNLPPERSDNQGRVRRIVDYAAGLGWTTTAPGLLDVGAGLGVFPWGMTQAGWSCTALDPDPRAAAHIRSAAGCPTVVGDFMALAADEVGAFDAVTFNKVLEHVADPVAMLARARPLLRPNGFVYVELPDVAAAGDPDGGGREEFFIEHIHVFSPASIALLIERAGFTLTRLARLREPSGKYTLYAFAHGA